MLYRLQQILQRGSCGIEKEQYKYNILLRAINYKLCKYH